MSANERRQSIIEALCERRYDNVGSLSQEFGVSIRTIKNDIEILTLSYPIETKRGKGGGVHIADGYYLGMKYFTYEQSALLEKISLDLVGEEKETMKRILKTFKRPILTKR